MNTDNPKCAFCNDKNRKVKVCTCVPPCVRVCTCVPPYVRVCTCVPPCVRECTCVRVFLGFLSGYPEYMGCFAAQTAGEPWCNNNTTSM